MSRTEPIRAPDSTAGSAGPSRSSARRVALVLLLGLALHVPSLFLGFYADDYVHRLALGERGELMPIRPWSLYDFGTRADWEAFETTEGAFPWWTSPDWAVRFFRPLASLSLWLDESVWGAHAFGQHLTSLGLYALLLVLVHLLFRALGLGPRTALCGLLLFALADGSLLPVGWIANRNSLLEALFAVAALALVARAPGVPQARTLLAALACATAAALAKESGACAFALVALVLVWRGRADPLGRRRALVGAAVAGALFSAWLAGLALAGYGTHSLFYVTPWREPLRFAAQLFVLASGSLVSFVAPLPLDLVTLAPGARPVLVALGILVGLPLALWIARSVARRAGAGLLCAWTLFFLVPQGGVAPSDRLLFVPSVGAAGLLALFFEAQRERARSGASSRAARVLGALLLATATLGSGASLLLQGLGLAGLAEHLRTTALATDLGPRPEAPLEAIVLQTESQMQAFTLSATWHGAGGDPRVRFWLAQSGTRALRWTRTAEAVFELESLGEPFLTKTFERVYLAREPAFASGATWRTALFTVEALAVDDGSPRALRWTFERSLDDPTLCFLRPLAGVPTRIAPPRVGESIVLPEPVPSRPFVP